MLFTDQLHRTIEIPDAPKRIISLVPSQTELLYDLGLRDEVVGVTKFCVHPNEWYRNKTRVGGTKQYDFEKIKILQPDLIIGNKEENEQEQIEALMSLYPVWMSDIYTLSDSIQMISQIGELVNKKAEATMMVSRIKSAFEVFYNFRASTALKQLKVAYFIWRMPYMVAASHTFIHHLLEQCGFKNVFAGDAFQRYPEITAQQLAQANPDVILLSSEPYPFKEKHVAEFQTICKHAKIVTVDGELFSWYGSRLLHAPDYFKGLIESLQ
ncbi:MAG TPA: helical backbone metal receptor [Bacteroidia bacterium]|jgi:ABC-type Fe3+-hydroxamate transport system substrate-binding protein|nr:helical backbone metal receptor [Bacteroidia bacterium]